MSGSGGTCGCVGRVSGDGVAERVNRMAGGPPAAYPPAGGDGRPCFDAYAVTTRLGPHVTMQAGVVHAGRHWTTVSRRSLKARTVGAAGWASVTVSATGGRRRIVAGPARVLDGLRPWTLVADPLAGILAGGAVLRMGAAHPDQLLGYAQGIGRVPAGFAPWGRALLVVEARDELVLDGDRVVGSRGRWAGVAAPLPPGPARRRRRPPQWIDRVPAVVADLVAGAGPCWLGVQDGAGSVAVPARWDPATATVVAPRPVLAALGPRLPGPVCVTLDDSSARRPDRKRGAMLRGTGRIVDGDEQVVEVAIRPDRVTVWDGFRTCTVPLGAGRPTGRPTGGAAATGR